MINDVFEVVVVTKVVKVANGRQTNNVASTQRGAISVVHRRRQHR
jgi:hypothetical protein